MKDRLQTINESIQPRGQVNTVSAGCNLYVSLDDDDSRKVRVSVDASCNSGRTQINESVDRVSSDKLELLKKDVEDIMNDVEKRLNQTVEKYGFERV